MEEKLNNQEPITPEIPEEEAAQEPETPTEAPIEKEGEKIAPEGKKPIITIATVIVALVLAGAAYYYMAGTEVEEPLGQQEAESIAAEIEGAADAVSEKLQEQGTSDEVADIEADLGATELDALDQEMQNIDAELNF